MDKKVLVILFIFVSGFGMVNGETKKVKIKDPVLKNTWEEFHVLKSDKSIRDGSYKHIVDGELSIEGMFNNGSKSGIWKWYSFSNKVELEIDYDLGELRYLHTDSVTKEQYMVESRLIPNGDRPFLSTMGSKLKLAYLKHFINYPAYARDHNITGIVMVGIVVNENGEVSSYEIKNQTHESLEEEALRVVKLIPLEFLPAYKDGQAIDSNLVFPISFTIF